MADTYLIVHGVLDDTWRFTPYPGFELPAPPPVPWPRDDEFRLICLGADDRPLLHTVPFVHRRGCGTVGDPERHLVLGVLPLPPGAAAYRLLRRDVQLHTGEVAPEPPRVPDPTMTVDGDDARLDWAPDAGLSYAVLAETVSGARVRLAEGLTDAPHRSRCTRCHRWGRCGCCSRPVTASDRQPHPRGSCDGTRCRRRCTSCSHRRASKCLSGSRSRCSVPGWTRAATATRKGPCTGTWTARRPVRARSRCCRRYRPAGTGSPCRAPGAPCRRPSQELVVAEPTDAYRAWRQVTAVQPG